MLDIIVHLLVKVEVGGLQAINLTWDEASGLVKNEYFNNNLMGCTASK